MPTFLNPLLRDSSQRFALENLRTGLIVAERLLPAFDPAARRSGLLSYDGLPAGTAPPTIIRS